MTDGVNEINACGAQLEADPSPTADDVEQVSIMRTRILVSVACWQRERESIMTGIQKSIKDTEETSDIT